MFPELQVKHRDMALAVGMAITGYIVWGATPSASSEYAKHSKFQQRVNGTFKHDHH